MADAMNFEIGSKFPLPIQAQGEGGLFQADANGLMFILKLRHLDVIAVEAFRTGAMEFALFAQHGLRLLLYQLDGIFKGGWGDAPLSFHNMQAAQLPTEKSLRDACLHIYLVDAELELLLAQRDIKLTPAFMQVLRTHVTERLAAPLAAPEFLRRLQGIYAQHPTGQSMRDAAAAVQSVPLDIPVPPSQRKLH